MINFTTPPCDSQIPIGGLARQSGPSLAVGQEGLSSFHISPLVPTSEQSGSFFVVDQDGVCVPPRDEPGLPSPAVKVVSPSVTVYNGGSLIKVQRLRVTSPQPGRAVVRRDEITHYSGGSRRRLLRKLGSTRREVLPLFVTLTYPADYSDNPRVWKRDLDVFCKRLRRHFEKAGAFWRLEFQRRGAPHYHLLVWGVEYTPLLKWVSRAWYEVVGSGDEAHLKAGTRVERLRSWKGAFAYASKYLAKKDTERVISGVGRFWGVIGRDNIPWAEIEQVAVSDDHAKKFLRWLRKYAGLGGRSFPSSLTVFCDASQWRRVVNQLE